MAGVRLFPDSPVVSIRVNHPKVDIINVYADSQLEGWKLDGRQGSNELAVPDQLQDQFDAVVSTLAEYVDETSVWTSTETGQVITPWEAMTLLTHFPEQG